MPADSRRIINASITLLALGLCALAGNMAWNAYRELAAAKRVTAINTMADRLIHAATLAAVERGMTAAALGAHQPVNGETPEKILGLRRDME